MEENSISPIRSDFEQIKKQNESGSEYWTSRGLCVALGIVPIKNSHAQ